MPQKTSTAPIIIVDNEYITVRYLPDKKIVYHTIHQPIDVKRFTSALAAGGEILKEKGACKWLSDDRKNGPLSQEGMAGPATWGPGLIAAGWKYWANVVPREIVAAGTLKPVMETLFDLGLRMNVFTNVEDAFKWLESMKD